MQDLKITRYAHPKAHGWAAYVEPKDCSFIMFIGTDNRPLVYVSRDPETGGILGDDTSPEAIATLRALPGLRIGMRQDGCDPENSGSLEIGERVFPLGIDGTGGIGIA